MAASWLVHLAPARPSEWEPGRHQIVCAAALPLRGLSSTGLLDRYHRRAIGTAAFRFGESRLHHLLALVAQMRAQDMGECDAIATAQRVENGVVLLDRHRPTLRRHRR